MKHLVVVAVFASLAVHTMASQNQPPSQKDARKSQQAPPAITVTSNDAAAYDEQDGKDKPQGRHKFVAWPEGITAWAIILTLGAIAWQAVETRRAVGVSKKSIVLQFRPKLSIRAFKFDLSQSYSLENGHTVWRFVLANVGGSTAYIHPTEIVFDSLVQDGKNEVIYPLGTEKIDSFSLVPGQIKLITSKITNAGIHLTVGKVFSDTSIGQYVWVRCTGSFVFTDDLKIERRIGFRRRFDAIKGTFIEDPDPEYEFDDET